MSSGRDADSFEALDARCAFVRPEDRGLFEQMFFALTRQGKSVVLASESEPLLDHYGKLLVSALRAQPQLQVEVYFPGSVDALLERVNQSLGTITLEQARERAGAEEPARVLVVTDARNVPVNEAQLLLRLVNDFPGANLRVVLMVERPEDAQVARLVQGFDRRHARWDIQTPNRVELEDLLARASAQGVEGDVARLVLRLGGRASAGVGGGVGAGLGLGSGVGAGGHLGAGAAFGVAGGAGASQKGDAAGSPGTPSWLDSGDSRDSGDSGDSGDSSDTRGQRVRADSDRPGGENPGGAGPGGHGPGGNRPGADNPDALGPPRTGPSVVFIALTLMIASAVIVSALYWSDGDSTSGEPVAEPAPVAAPESSPNTLVGTVLVERVATDVPQPEAVAPAAEPAPAEPASAEPAKPEPAKPEPAKPEPAKPEPPKPEPPKPEPVKPEPTKPEPPKPAPAPIVITVPAPAATTPAIPAAPVKPAAPAAPAKPAAPPAPPAPPAPAPPAPPAPARPVEPTKPAAPATLTVPAKPVAPTPAPAARELGANGNNRDNRVNRDGDANANTNANASANANARRVLATPPGHYFVQMAARRTAEEAERWRRGRPDSAQTLVLRVQGPVPDYPWIIVAGPFETREAAIAAQKREGVPADAWVRSARALQNVLRNAQGEEIR